MAALGALAARAAARPAVIGLYGTDASTADAIRSLARDPLLAGKTSFEVVELDADRPLEARLRERPRLDLVLGLDGMAFSSKASLFEPLDETVARKVPSALRSVGRVGNLRYGLPLEADHFELAYNRPAFYRAGLGEPRTLPELLDAAKKLARPGIPSLFVAGAEDGDLLLLLAALVESLDGPAGYRRLADSLAVAPSLSAALHADIGADSLGSILDSLISLRKIGVLHPEWFRMKSGDIKALAENGLAPIILMPLSAHRTIALATIVKYKSVFIPPRQATSSRAFAAPILVGAVPAGARRRKEASAFLYALLENHGQERLCGATGLAPASASAEALDQQASDVRLWIASSQGALADLGRASKGDEASRRALASGIRAYLEAEGRGF